MDVRHVPERERRASTEQATISEQDGAAQLKPSASGLAPEDMEGILAEDIGRRRTRVKEQTIKHD